MGGMSRRIAERLRALDDHVLRHAFLFVELPLMGLILSGYGLLSWSWLHADWGPGAAAARADHSYHRSGAILLILVAAGAVTLLFAGWRRLRGRRYWPAALMSACLIGVVIFGGHVTRELAPHDLCACEMP